MALRTVKSMEKEPRAVSIAGFWCTTVRIVKPCNSLYFSGQAGSGWLASINQITLKTVVLAHYSPPKRCVHTPIANDILLKTDEKDFPVEKNIWEVFEPKATVTPPLLHSCVRITLVIAQIHHYFLNRIYEVGTTWYFQEKSNYGRSGIILGRIEEINWILRYHYLRDIYGIL